MCADSGNTMGVYVLEISLYHCAHGLPLLLSSQVLSECIIMISQLDDVRG